MSNQMKKISYLSAITIMVGTTIGSGIFLKNHSLFQLAHGSLMLTIASWLVASVGIIALGMAVVEMSSASKTNRGTLDWAKNFLPRWLYLSSKNYVQIIFAPITLFTVPIYAVQTFQDAGWNLSGLEVLLFAFAIFFWIAMLSLISLKLAEKFQWIITAVKFVPILVLPIIAFSHTGDFNILNKDTKLIGGNVSGLDGISGGMVVIAGIPSIAFAFDGFYEVSSLRNDMENPKRVGSVILVGLGVIVTSYLFLTLAFGVGTESGSYTGIVKDKKLHAIFGSMIGIGVIGIANGYMMGSVEQNRAIFDNNESPIMKGFQKSLDKMKIWVADRTLSWLTIFGLTTLLFLIFGPIGIYAWSTNNYGAAYQHSAATLYTLNDILVNYTSLLMFLIVAGAVVGALINRRTKRVEVEKSKYFIPAAIICATVLFSGGIYVLVSAFVDLSGYNGADVKDDIIQLSVLAVIFALSIIPSMFELRKPELPPLTKHEKRELKFKKM